MQTGVNVSMYLPLKLKKVKLRTTVAYNFIALLQFDLRSEK